MSNPLKMAAYPALSGPFATPPAAGDVLPSPAVSRLVGSQVRALLESSPAYHDLSREKQERMRQDMEKIAAYSAALIRDDWATSAQLGQVPVLHQQTVLDLAPMRADSTNRALSSAQAKKDEPPPPTPFDQFDPRASQAAKLTRDTLNAIAFPTFVADLIKGTFQAIVDASIQQMEAYATLLANVAKTVDQFMADNISDNNARDYLVQSYPGHFQVDTSDGGPRVKVRANADNLPKPDFRAQYNLPEDVSLDDDTVEQTLVPAARRQLAQQRHSLLSTMMLMGINRIVITNGRINAKMGFRIDTKDQGHAQTASEFDVKHESEHAAAGFMGGFGGLAGGYSRTRNTVAYVSSTKKDSSDEIDLHADLTGEVDLKFKSDYFPMERFAKPEMIALIQGHTPNPAANAPAAANANTSGTGVKAVAGNTE